MSDTSLKTYKDLCKYVKETAILQSVDSLLQWDERTLLPPAGGEYRAQQISYLAGLIHERRTSSQLGEWLEELLVSPLLEDPHSDSGANIRQLHREYQKQVKVPQSLVEELTRTSILGQQTWVEARKNDDFQSFQKILSQIIHLKQQQADCIGYEGCRYDALLDDFEPDAQTDKVREVLDNLRRDLVPLVAAIVESGNKAPLEILKRTFSISAQRSFGRQAAEEIGFDFNGGRLDETHHPFCSGMGPRDCRITTRYDDRFFSSAFFGTLHEAGHGIYEQGLRADQYGLPSGSYTSLGIHESQSRMWENLVGRSRAFWTKFYPPAQQTFDSLENVTLEDFFYAINDVRPSLIRVEADEATYNLHIIVRFELEQALINEDLPVNDLPQAWNESYQKYLGIEPPNDADGVLQDIHWSAALIGYFPTYALGNLYACQFFEQADIDLGGIDQQLSDGRFTPLRDWLRQNIHQSGQCYSASQLVEKVTGKPLTHKPLLEHLRKKLVPLYGIS